jgi:hypothetical protein
MFEISQIQNKSLDVIVVSALEQYPLAKVIVSGTPSKASVEIVPVEQDQSMMLFSIMENGTIIIHEHEPVYGDWGDEDEEDDCYW